MIFILMSTTQLTSFFAMYFVYVFRELDKTFGNSVKKLWYDTPQKATPEYGQQAVINYIILT